MLCKTKASRSGGSYLHLAAAKGDISLLQRLVHAGGDLQAMDTLKGTPLIHAIRSGMIETCKWILETDPRTIKHPSENELDPLLHAAKSKQWDIARVLVTTGADVRASGPGYGFTCLHYAAKDRQYELALALIERGADLEARNSHGSTPIARAVGSEDEQMVRLLLEAGANGQATDREGRGMLHLAAMAGHLRIAGLLLSFGVDINYCDDLGRTSLHYAANWDQEEFCAWILNREDPIDFNVADNRGRTPLHCAASQGFQDTSLFLRDHGADCRLADLDGLTAIDIAMMSWHGHLAHLLASEENIVASSED
jgi:ankyrin repeat protein